MGKFVITNVHDATSENPENKLGFSSQFFFWCMREKIHVLKLIN